MPCPYQPYSIFIRIKFFLFGIIIIFSSFFVYKIIVIFIIQ